MEFAALQGFAIGGSLIIAIGGQNAYVIQQGVRGERIFLVATLCFLADALLISIGTAGLGTLIATNPLLRQIAAWGGALFLIVYGAKSAYAIIRPNLAANAANDEANIQTADSLKRVILTTLAFTFLNPHVYLDTVVLLGGIAAQYDSQDRFAFTIGAIFASLLWFYGLAFTAQKIAPFFRTTFGARALDAVICTVMWTVAGSLVVGVLNT